VVWPMSPSLPTTRPSPQRIVCSFACGILPLVKKYFDWNTMSPILLHPLLILLMASDWPSPRWMVRCGFGLSLRPNGRQLLSLWTVPRSHLSGRNSLQPTTPPAYCAIWTLAASPTIVLPFLAKRLVPVPKYSPERIRQLIADLDHDDFHHREAVTRELSAAGIQAEPFLRQCLSTRLMENDSDVKRLAELPLLDAALRSPKRGRGAGSVNHLGDSALCNEASSFSKAAGSTGLTRWKSNPACSERRRSSSCPHPVSATSTTFFPHASSRMRRAAA
jgi:hypothetical protein